MDEVPEALRLADDRPSSLNDDLYQWAIAAEDELRRLHAENEKFRKHIESQNDELDELIPMAEKLETENEALREANSSLATAAILPDDKMIVNRADYAELVEALVSFTKSDYIKKQHPKRYAKAVAALAKVEARDGS